MRIHCTKALLTILLFAIILPQVSKDQGFDSTIIGKEYPYALPMLGKKTYKRGYKIPLPHGIMVNGLVNKQNIILTDFKMAFTDPDVEPDSDRLQPISDLIVFGPSYRLEVQPRMNLRIDFGFGNNASGFYFNFNESH
jgi:hypothetical protein